MGCCPPVGSGWSHLLCCPLLYLRSSCLLLRQELSQANPGRLVTDHRLGLGVAGTANGLLLGSRFSALVWLLSLYLCPFSLYYIGLFLALCAHRSSLAVLWISSGSAAVLVA